MFFLKRKNLLPTKLVDGVALKTSVSKIQLSRLRGWRKLRRFTKLPKFSRTVLGGLLLFYLLGYQPTIAFPPITKAIAQTPVLQEQSIEGLRLSQPFNLPHPGYLTTKFSSWHPGIDIAVGLGTPVRSIIQGVVSEVSWGFFGLGHYVVIEHEQGFKSTYGHMGKIFVKKGDEVGTSSILGEVGMTGRTSGPHTHLEITKNGRFVNPEALLPPISNWPAFGGPAPKGEGKAQPTPKPKPSVTPTPVKIPLLKMEGVGFTTPKEAKLPHLLGLPKELL